MASRIRASNSLRDELMIQQKSSCAHCGVLLQYYGDIPLFDVDHKVQFALSGDNSFDNLQLLCVECHRIKSVTERRIRAKPTPAQKYIQTNLQRIKFINNPFAKYALYSDPDINDLNMELLELTSKMETNESMTKIDTQELELLQNNDFGLKNLKL